jgi:hypothetical protein
MKREEFFRLLEEATEVRSDRGWYLVRLPGEGWRLFSGAPTPQMNRHLAPLEAHLLAEGEEALDRARALGLGLWRGAA